MHGLNIRRISQVALTVDDPEAAVAFYRDTLGLPLLFRAGTMAFFDCGGTHLLVSAENETDTRTLLYFEVDDIQAAWSVLAGQGADLHQPPHVVAKLEDRDVWLASFRDPAGTLHHLMTERKREPAAP